MFKPFFQISFLLFFTFNISAQVELESEYVDRIMSSEVFQTKKNEIEKLSKGERTLKLLLYSEPKDKQTFYFYKAYEDNGVAYISHLLFRVYPESGIVYLYDPIKNKESKIE